MFGIIIENYNHYLLMARDASEVWAQFLRLVAYRWFGRGPLILAFEHRFEPNLRYWLEGGVPIFTLLALLLGFLYFSIVQRNPLTGLALTFKAFFGTIMDFLRLPFGLRRILALAKVAAKEAIRGQVLYVFGLFLLPMAFAGWYLPKVPDGKLLYLVGYVNTAMTYTLLPMAAFMVSMSLPKDIQSRVIQTVATKPVRRLEILVGRIVGYTAIFSVVLALMAVASLLFVYGQLTKKDREDYWLARAPIYANRMPAEARKSYMDGASADFKEAQAKAMAGAPKDAALPSREDVEKAARDYAEASVPKDGMPMMFRRKEGWDVKGLNVGKEWFGQRWHVPGAYNSQAVAAFGFEFDKRNLEVASYQGRNMVRVFVESDIYKSNKGDARREEGVGKNTEKSGVFGEITVKGAGPNFVKSFPADHLRALVLYVPPEIFGDGKVEIHLRCLSPGQFIGVGHSDVYFLTGEASFAANFMKAMLSLWLKLFFLVTVAVSCSAALKGFVAALATAAVFLLGTQYEFLMGVVDPRKRQQSGGGPIESFLRLFLQTNQVTPLDDSVYTTVVKFLDEGILTILEKAAYFVPNLADLDTIEYVARGIDLPWSLELRNLLFVLTFALPALLAGHLVLKHRELAAT